MKTKDVIVVRLPGRAFLFNRCHERGLYLFFFIPNQKDLHTHKAFDVVLSEEKTCQSTAVSRVNRFYFFRLCFTSDIISFYV